MRRPRLRNRGVCARGAVHVCIRAVHAVCDARRPQWQPRHVCAALPTAVCTGGKRPGQRPDCAEPEGFMSAGLRGAAAGERRGFPENRGADETAGIRGGCGDRLSCGRGRTGGGSAAAGGFAGGVFPVGLYRRLLPRSAGCRIVRSPQAGGCHRGDGGGVQPAAPFI